MKTEVKTFIVLVPFFLLVSAIYAWTTDFGEWVGIIGLFLTALFAAWIAAYLWLAGRKTDPRPEDNLQGEIADAAGDYGHFAPYSWWPLALGLSTTMLAAGIAIGWWMFIIAAPFVAISVVGWAFEFFRGAKAV